MDAPLQSARGSDDNNIHGTPKKHNRGGGGGAPPKARAGKRRGNDNSNTSNGKSNGSTSPVPRPTKRATHAGNKPASASSTTNNNNGTKNGHGKPSKQDRKAGRRAAQLAKMDAKAVAEDLYFRQCQQESTKQRNKSNNKKAPLAADEQALFGNRVATAVGIDFAKYDDIRVDVKDTQQQQTSNATAAADNVDTRPLQGTFADVDWLPPTVAHTVLHRLHYTTPTPIQKHAMPWARAGRDVMCCAQTGSGKTCAFLLPICTTMLDPNRSSPPQPPVLTPNGARSCTPVALVLAPTRELASQIEGEAQKLTFGTSTATNALTTVAVYGGVPARPQLAALAQSYHAETSSLLIVATPGRLHDFVSRGLVNLRAVQYLVLDEADRMLDMGFEPQIRKLVQTMRSKESGRQTLLFSATFAPEIQRLASEFLRSYVWIAVGRVGSTTDSITQVLVKATADKRKKLKLVVKAIQDGPSGRTLVFCQKKATATWLKKQLVKGGPTDAPDHERFPPISAQDIHGDRSQSQREAALAAFRDGSCRVLVATDVAARGLDVSGIEHVINMDLPVAADDFDSYVHRIGRTGRAGHAGLATSLYVPGVAAKVGNGKIAALLSVQLREAGQEIPDWLEEDGGGATAMAAAASAPPRDVRTSSRSGRGQGGRGRGRGRGAGRGRSPGRGRN